MAKVRNVSNSKKVINQPTLMCFMGPYLVNIGITNHVLVKQKKIQLSYFLLNLILKFIFKISPFQSQNQNHQNSMCDISKDH